MEQTLRQQNRSQIKGVVSVAANLFGCFYPHLKRRNYKKAIALPMLSALNKDDTAVSLSPQTAPERAPELAIKNVSKSFGAFQALRQLTLSVSKGEFICLLGPSGCGKTTLLRLIAGLESPDGGEIYQNGRNITHASPAERDYGMVFQSYALFPNLTAHQNIAYGLYGGQTADTARRVTDLLELINLPAIGNKYPAQLSGGQQQRVALARALATSPQLLLLDEPLSALDAQVRTHLRSEIKSLQKKLGITTIMVTHDQEEALTMADRVVVMNQGVIAQIGTPDEIYHHPANRFVANFVGRCNWIVATATSPNTIQLGNATLRVTSNIALQTGQRYAFLIRPESVELQPHWQAHPQVALGALQQIELMGNVYRLRLLVAEWGNLELEVILNHRELAELNLNHGQLIPVKLPPHQLRPYAEDCP
jgi:iron(III) transport system ATP-binding protein